mmetsp:Transcript_4510/g.15854  ORF Transcript_4510/g.15854 Transcript_4510/m.15854 type:complete len:299 (+) Transcript_4510:20-916(+)
MYCLRANCWAEYWRAETWRCAKNRPSKLSRTARAWATSLKTTKMRALLRMSAVTRICSTGPPILSHSSRTSCWRLTSASAMFATIFSSRITGDDCAVLASFASAAGSTTFPAPAPMCLAMSGSTIPLPSLPSPWPSFQPIFFMMRSAKLPLSPDGSCSPSAIWTSSSWPSAITTSSSAAGAAAAFLARARRVSLSCCCCRALAARFCSSLLYCSSVFGLNGSYSSSTTARLLPCAIPGPTIRCTTAAAGAPEDFSALSSSSAVLCRFVGALDVAPAVTWRGRCTRQRGARGRDWRQGE